MSSVARMYRFTRDHNRVARHELRSHVEQLSRAPFGDVLEQLLQARPSLEQLVEWAAKDPARWALATKVFAGLTGYTEHLDVRQHITVEHLGDAEILARLARVRSAVLDGGAPLTIEQLPSATQPPPAVQPPSSIQNLNESAAQPQEKGAP